MTHTPPTTARGVADALRAGAHANRAAACRHGSIDIIRAPGRLIATGDLHDNPANLDAVVRAAGLDGHGTPCHLTLHELIHPPTLRPGDIDRSWRALVRVAMLKADHPELVHVLLANHELAQALGTLIHKNGVRVVDAFNAGLHADFGDQASAVRDAVFAFVMSMPLALRCECPQGDILCAHSLPGPAIMGRFDATILSRDLRPADYESRGGSAYAMVWGRGYDADQLEDLTERWGVNLFILGHEHTPRGFALVEPNALVLNTDHDRGVYLPIDLSNKPRLHDCPALVVPIHPG